MMSTFVCPDRTQNGIEAVPQGLNWEIIKLPPAHISGY